ncbi:hypothetical protein B0I35DRAFT_436329 [Stachybotrys elegans]|uniref:Uncharacterized protein n=1 Tax=Stachybotrys elegans TaxID=80388 RepID=A0A8K0SJI8_9HYPO|nr:hypothetical protein B0I35DRAFT_436329 [Stachybotrys elegans]
MARPRQPGARAEDGSWHYHLSHVYELNNPVEKSDMQEEGWINWPIPRYSFLPPAVVSQLMWNLRHAIHDDDVVQDNATPTPSASLSQQIEEQIRSDIAYSTQAPPSDAVLVPSTPEEEEDEVAYMEYVEQFEEASTAAAAPSSPSKHQRAGPPSDSSPSYQDYGGSLASDPLREPPLPMSSPLLTNSQILSDSLLRDDDRVPPEIWDSDDDPDARL